jgi:hypothetical protein
MTESILALCMNACATASPAHEFSHTGGALQKCSILEMAYMESAEVAKIDRLRERQGSFSARRGIYLSQSVSRMQVQLALSPLICGRRSLTREPRWPSLCVVFARLDQLTLMHLDKFRFASAAAEDVTRTTIYAIDCPLRIQQSCSNTIRDVSNNWIKTAVNCFFFDSSVAPESSGWEKCIFWGLNY